MERKLILAVVLSAMVLLGYNYLVTKVYHLEKPAPLTLNKETSPILPESSLPAAEIKQEKSTPSSISLERNMLEDNNLKVKFINLGANIEEIYLPSFKKRFFETGLFNLQETRDKPFSLVSAEANKIAYVFNDGQKKISKIYRISNNAIELEIVVENLSNAAQDVALHLDYFSLNLQQEDADFKKDKNFFDLVISLPDKVLRKNIARITAKDNIFAPNQFNWIGLKDRYFCTIVQPEAHPSGYYTQVSDSKMLTIGEQLNITALAPRSSAQFKLKLFAGPLDAQVLKSADLQFLQIINFGAFDAISKGLLNILRFVHKILPNWGLCIIILSLFLFFLMYPLTLKSLKSMKSMQEMQPAMEKLRRENKDNPQKLNKEIMELYKRNHINPLGGCLPMILQIPVFFALYQALLRSLELRGSNFLWIKDLSEPDRLFILPNNLPFLGNELNILPILMAIVMFLQQKSSSKSTVSANPEQQKLMLIFFPILFGFMFYRLASGLVLYWFVYSSLSLIFQWKQMRVAQKS